MRMCGVFIGSPTFSWLGGLRERRNAASRQCRFGVRLPPARGRSLGPRFHRELALSRGQREDEGRADSLLALDPDPAAMAFDDLAANRQAEPGALDRPPMGSDLLELVEHGFPLVARDADPGVD